MTVIYLAGVYNISLALFHLLFWKLFDWRKDLLRLSHANKAIMQIFNVQMIYYFLFVAVVCFWLPSELTFSKLGKVFLGGNTLFWFIRVIQQFVFLRINDYRVHILTGVFVVGTILFGLATIM